MRGCSGARHFNEGTGTVLGHYCDALNVKAEDRLLTSRLAPHELLREDGRRCIVGAAQDAYSLRTIAGLPFVAFAESGPMISWITDAAMDLGVLERRSVTSRFDALCIRFGTERITHCIRDRILRNRLWRVLRTARELSGIECVGLG